MHEPGQHISSSFKPGSFFRSSNLKIIKTFKYFKLKQIVNIKTHYIIFKYSYGQEIRMGHKFIPEISFWNSRGYFQDKLAGVN